MEKYIFDQSNGLWYALQGNYYIPCLVLDEAGTSSIGMWGRKHQQYLKEQPFCRKENMQTVSAGAVLGIAVH